MSDKEKAVQGYEFLLKIKHFVAKTLQDATDPLAAQIRDLQARNTDLEATVQRQKVVFEADSARIRELETTLQNLDMKFTNSINNQNNVIRQEYTIIAQEETARREHEEKVTQELQRMTETWREAFVEKYSNKIEEIEKHLANMNFCTKDEVHELVDEKMDASQYETMKQHVTATLMEFDRMVKIALDIKADKEEVDKVTARLLELQKELLEIIESKNSKLQVTLNASIEKKANKVDIYTKDVVDNKLRQKMDVPYTDQIPYEISFMPEEVFSVDMLPERAVAIPIPDTIPSKATHVQMSIQFHLTDHVSTCCFSMSTFRSANPISDNTQSLRVSWLTDKLREVLWTFQINGKYGRTLFAKWTDDRPQWQMVREWVSHYSCRALVKPIAWEIYDENSIPIASIPPDSVDITWTGSTGKVLQALEPRSEITPEKERIEEVSHAPVQATIPESRAPNWRFQAIPEEEETPGIGYGSMGGFGMGKPRDDKSEYSVFALG